MKTIARIAVLGSLVLFAHSTVLAGEHKVPDQVSPKVQGVGAKERVIDVPIGKADRVVSLRIFERIKDAKDTSKEFAPRKSADSLSRPDQLGSVGKSSGRLAVIDQALSEQQGYDELTSTRTELIALYHGGQTTVDDKGKIRSLLKTVNQRIAQHSERRNQSEAGSGSGRLSK